MKRIHLLSAVIGVIFGIVSTLLLIFLRAKGVIAIIVLWTLVPVLIKKGVDRVKKFKNGKKT